ncbi:MAG TPA: hypothetical protein VM582_00420, partial [Candidatus Thermoplasmatota archaeon]|nr:hypothetical protein [Candidatus Thermoplasmatota archaeon]
MDVRADPSRILGIGAIALALLAGAGRAAAQLGAFASVRPGLWLGLGSALVYLLAALCLAEPARRAGARAWWLVALLASMPLVPATAMALASPAAWVALAPLAPLWYFAPVSLGLAAWLAARARGERLRPLPLALAALYVAVDL